MLTIVDYNAGNLRSVQRACDAVGLPARLARTPEELLDAERIIFPGVGHAQSALETLRRTGLAGALRTAVARGTPVLGICLGCQIILDATDESNVPALGLIPGRTLRFGVAAQGLKVPHIGWNGVTPERRHPLLDGVKPEDEFYFVHSYYPRPSSSDNVYATTEYGERFCCAVGHRNLFATQFHPEKSGRLGLEILERFAAWNGAVPEQTPC